MRSDKSQAEPFQDWVCGDVLPSIRKHGAYMTDNIIERTLTDPDYLIQLATALKDERQKRIEAEQSVKEAQPAITFTKAICFLMLDWRTRKANQSERHSYGRKATFPMDAR